MIEYNSIYFNLDTDKWVRIVKKFVNIITIGQLLIKYKKFFARFIEN